MSDFAPHFGDTPDWNLPMISLRFFFLCCAVMVVTALTDAADSSANPIRIPDNGEALHPSWAELRNARWPGEPASEEEFGPAVDGVRLAARALTIRDPDAQRVAVAVTVWNDNDGPMSFYGFGWSAELLPHGRAPRSQSAYVGGPKPTWYGTLTMEAQEKLSYVIAARVDDAARLSEQAIVKVRFHLVPGLKKWAPGAVISQGHLLSAPITCAWPTQPEAGLHEAITLLKQALGDDQTASATLLKHPHAIAACEEAFTTSDISAKELISFILKNPSLSAEHVVLDALCRGGPWTWARYIPNNWAWEMAELEGSIPGVVTGKRSDLALAIADLSVDLTRKRNLEGPAYDTYSALLAWNHRWDAAIAAQRWAMERNKGDEQSQREMAFRLAILVANQAMPADQAPGPFASDAISGDSARDALISTLNDHIPLVAGQAARLLQEQFADDGTAQTAVAEYQKRHQNVSGSGEVNDF